jgi:hypothetical protein
MSQSIDPVSSPEAYRRFILSALGDDDPVVAQTAAPGLMRDSELIASVPYRRSAEDRARVGIHTERGPESYELTFRLVAGHDRVHLGQARRALDQVRGR